MPCNLPKNWNLKPIKDIAEVVSGGTPSRETSEYWEGGTINWVVPSDITRTHGRLLSDTADKITDRGLQHSAAKLLPPGTLLMTSRATLGEVLISSTETCTNQGFKSLVPTKDIHNWYLFYQIQINKDKYKNLGVGSTFLEVNKKDTEEFLIPIAPYAQQLKIAKILTTVDNQIEKTEALIEKYQAVKQGMIHDLFTRGVDENGQLRTKQEDAPHLYKKSEQGWIPKDWETKALGHYMSLVTYGFTNPMPEAKDGPWMVTAANINNGKIVFEKCRHTSEAAFETLITNKSRPIMGDILLTKDGTLGRLAIVGNEKLCINQSVALLRPKAEVNGHFFKKLLEAEKYQKQMLDDAGGSTIKHIYITIVDKMPISVPIHREEQVTIATIIHNQDKLIEKEVERLNKIKALKTGLMQDLLTGKTSVTPDEEEAA